MLDDRARVAIEAHALRCYPNEACGLIVNDGYIACSNIAVDPAHGFVIAPAAYTRAEEQGAIQTIVHSHPDTGAWPSIADLLAREASSVPEWIIVSVRRGADHWPAIERVHRFGHSADCIPLLGVPFVHGATDCYGLVRRYYLAALNLDLPDFARAGHWWEHAHSSLYVDNYEAAGFVSVGRDAILHEGDVLFMAIASRHGIPNHAAIYLGGDEILHHLWNQLSRREGLPRYRAHVTHVMRHKETLEWNR
ncbi:NLP/P60 protein [Caballeronia pedi]|uniref:NLP/P60 protein n=1 Tax=Caballeronia pedi TaxID=1777141 RepID=A0A158BHN2_9BURK|nr:C40 family peptidase [Caballeronia pedi]SAK69440.1 NLP/P60 protein [Caballeronia pedi]